MNLPTSPLIDSLGEPSIWPDHPEQVNIIETHISWVLLTRDFAWKIRKPVHFDFLDFSTLELRRHFSEEELRLNRRTAPELYLKVVPICGNCDAPEIDGTGEPIEFTVKMRRFEQSQLLSHLAEENQIRVEHIDELAEHVAAFHHTIPSANTQSDFGLPRDIHQNALDNFSAIEQFSKGCHIRTESVHRLRNWTETEFHRLANVFEQRRVDGFIRECHGDLHLRNIVELESGPCLFDSLEFNEKLRWIDVISEIAFLIMDLEERQLEHFARRFLNRYLELTGDYAGLQVLRYYLVYRAMVRAKVDMIQVKGSQDDEYRQGRLLDEFRGYLSVARHDAREFRPAIVIMHGYSGSGKTTFSQQLVENSHAIRIRSDVERKRLFGVAETERVEESAAEQLYSHSASQQTYERLATLTEYIMNAGFPAVVDAAFLDAGLRDRFCELAKRLNVPFRIVSCAASSKELQNRLSMRQARARDASDAGVAVLKQQLELTTREHHVVPPDAVRVETSNADSVNDTLKRLCRELNGAGRNSPC